ncbi:hypothetical protein HT031_005173 [Scenedesmus sp. PABB004]|nr:hypothetical protein HT031_005173 [Scenedesmus sp. PABB004]
MLLLRAAARASRSGAGRRLMAQMLLLPAAARRGAAAAGGALAPGGAVRSLASLLNAPGAAVVESLDGFLACHPHLARLEGVPDVKVVVDPRHPGSRVALISGGGSGHEPAHAGYVGHGMLAAAVAGDVFASPPAAAVLAAIRAVTGPGGALLVVKNYTGDRLNFGLAAEQAKAEGLAVEVVLVGEDAALAAPRLAGRRGLAGTVLVHKIAGAAAAAGAPLGAVAALARRVAERSATLGVALRGCTLPGHPPTTRPAPGEVELGLGIHGEPGAAVLPLAPAAELVGVMMERLVAAPATASLFAPGARVALLVNSLGATPALEMGVVARDALAAAEAHGVCEPRRAAPRAAAPRHRAPPWPHPLTLLALTPDMEPLLPAPTDAPAWPANGGAIAPRRSAAPRVVLLPAAPGPAPDGAAPAPGGARDAALEACVRAAAAALQGLTGRRRRRGRHARGGAAALLCALDGGALPSAPPGDALRGIAGAISAASGGTSGALYAVGLTVAAAALSRAGPSPAVGDWAAAFDAGVAAVARVGGAGPRCRTMLDALLPAGKALHAAAAAGQGAAAAAAAAAEAAAAGAEATRAMPALAGRASYVPAAAVAGVPDAGASPARPPISCRRGAGRRRGSGGAAAAAAAVAAAPLAAEPATTLAVLAVCAAAGQLAEAHTRLGALASAPLLALAAALAAAAAGALPAASPVYDAVWCQIMPLGVALFLLDTADVGELAGRGRGVLVAFLLGAACMVAGALAAWAALGGALGPHGAALASCLLASYIGGSVNFAAVAAATGLPAGLVPAAIAADNLAMLGLLAGMMAVPVRALAALRPPALSGWAGGRRARGGAPEAGDGAPLGLDGQDLLTAPPAPDAVAACLEASAHGRRGGGGGGGARGGANPKQLAGSSRAVTTRALDGGPLLTPDPPAPAAGGNGKAAAAAAKAAGAPGGAASAACGGCRASGVTALDEGPLLTTAPAMGDAISAISAARDGRQQLLAPDPPGTPKRPPAAPEGVVGCGCCSEALDAMAAAQGAPRAGAGGAPAAAGPGDARRRAAPGGPLALDGGALETAEPEPRALDAALAAARAGRSGSGNVSVSETALTSLASTESVDDLELVARFDLTQLRTSLDSARAAQAAAADAADAAAAAARARGGGGGGARAPSPPPPAPPAPPPRRAAVIVAAPLLLLSGCALALSAGGGAAARAAAGGGRPAAPFAGAASLGAAAMGLFFATLGASCACPLSSLSAVAPLAGFVVVMVSVHWLLLGVVGRLVLKLPVRALLVGSACNVGGPATAAGIASARGFSALVQPALLCGSLGYALGTGGGLALAKVLGALPA